MEYWSTGVMDGPESSRCGESNYRPPNSELGKSLSGIPPPSSCGNDAFAMANQAAGN